MGSQPLTTIIAPALSVLRYTPSNQYYDITYNTFTITMIITSILPTQKPPHTLHQYTVFVTYFTLQVLPSGGARLASQVLWEYVTQYSTIYT